MSETRRTKPEESRIGPEDIARAKVSLGPFLGMAPATWVPAAWLASLALALFCLLALPGILSPEALLDVRGAPSGAAVSVDGHYLGFSGMKIRVKPGSHRVELSRPGFETARIEIVTGSRLFGSLFFPKRHRISYSLKAVSPDTEAARAYADFARWSDTGKPSAAYQIPPVLSDSLLALAETGGLSGSGLAAARPMASGTLGVASSPQALREGLRAAFLAAGAGVASPSGLASGIRAVLSSSRLGARAPVRGSAAAYLSDMLPRENSRARKALDTLAGKLPESAAPPLPLAPAKPAVPAADISGVVFMPVAGGVQDMAGLAPSGSAVPYREALSGFALAATETTVGQWAAFLAANPAWAPSRRDDLVAGGLADSSYLAGWNPAADRNLPVTGVSWHAAAAYCSWLSRVVEPAYAVVLPTEAMWERAASSASADAKAVWASSERTGPSPVGSKGRSASGHADLFGNVWEWTSDSWAAYPLFAAAAPVSPEKAVRGGSWANADKSVVLGSRGGIDAAHASAFLGFRPALVKR